MDEGSQKTSLKLDKLERYLDKNAKPLSMCSKIARYAGKAISATAISITYGHLKDTRDAMEDLNTTKNNINKAI